MRKSNMWVLCVAALLMMAGRVWAADDAPKIDSGDTAWILVSSALVLLMTPGLAFFYSGMVHRKNVLGSIMQCFSLMGLITVQWVVIGYTLSFGDDIGSFIGNFKYLLLRGVGAEPGPFAATIPHNLFMVFQMMFAIITPALIFGAVAERMKFSAMLVFSLLWATLVYNPICHWVWGGGWLGKLHAMDFAGGTVVHISSGFSALVCALVLGARRGDRKLEPHNLTLTVLGAGLLWFGWFGFNGGSSLAANGAGASAFVNTHIAAATAALVWMLVEWRLRGKPSMLGVASGCVAGLVAITPAAGFVTPGGSLIIGALAGLVCLYGVTVKNKFGFDDTLDVFGIHGLGGTLGALLTGVFCVKVAVENGGMGNQVLVQAISVVATIAYAMVVTWILLKIIDAIMGLRISPEEEEQGLDTTQHGESGYNL
jgi:Amt family ammonium transporter